MHRSQIQGLLICLLGLTASGCAPRPSHHANTIRPAITEDDIDTRLDLDQADDTPLERPVKTRVSANREGEPARLAGMVSAHNQVLARVESPALRWSSALARQAQDWADHLQTTKSCEMEHSHAPNVGENLAWASGQHLTPAAVVDMWARESRDFDPASGRCTPGAVCGHYTQIVWRNTREVGCAMASCGRAKFGSAPTAPPATMSDNAPSELSPPAL